MEITSLPLKMQKMLLQDAIQRDRTTARRACLLHILWRERFLKREHLIVRVEGTLGKDCFGDSSWEDVFFRDMRVVKQALKADGHELVYSRNSKNPGYYLRDQPALGPDLSGVLEGSISEVDPAQIAIYRRMSLKERFQQGVSISDTAREVVAYRIRRRNPELSSAEAHRLALQKREIA